VRSVILIHSTIDLLFYFLFVYLFIYFLILHFCSTTTTTRHRKLLVSRPCCVSGFILRSCGAADRRSRAEYESTQTATSFRAENRPNIVLTQCGITS
ncbi:hypothetical protein AOLI_G00165820, partial [Acnodon oligacanthus]